MIAAGKPSGYYHFQYDHQQEPLYTYCDTITDGGIKFLLKFGVTQGYGTLT